jgi:hypothetical protein
VASIKAQIDILLTGQRNISNLLGQLNEIEGAIAQIESKWKVASAALQRADIRLGATGRQQPRGEGGRFASDPDRRARVAALADRRRAAVEQRLARMGLSTASRQEASIRDQIEGNERILRQTERRITFQERLNSAVQLFETRQQKLARGGGGRGLSQGLQERAREIQAAFEAAGGGASRNLALINSLATGLGRVVERQNEFNRLQALGTKGFEAGRRLQERIDVVAQRGVIPSRRIDRLRGGAARVIATSESGDQQAYSEAVRAATAAISRVERESRRLAGDLARNAARSPIRGGTGFPGSPKALVEAASAAVALDKQRQSALEKIFQVEEKIRSSKKISFKEAQDYYFQAQLPRTALPFGDVSQPAMRGGARRGGTAREILGGARTADEAETTFRLIEEKSKKTAKAIKQSFADAYEAALPPDALSGLTALEKVGKALTSMKGGGVAGQEKQRKELDALQQALSAMEGRKYDPLGISDQQINAGLNERASQLQRILQIEEKIRSSRKISAKEAQEYYSRTQLPRLALPLGDVNQPAIRGGARQGGSAREFLGGGRSAEEAETTFRLIEEKARKTGKTIKQSFADAYKAMLPPDTLLTGLAALGKVGKTLASMKVGGGGQSGLQAAIESLREARGAREGFFGGASPAEAIDKIVREFNTGKPAVTEAAGNITQSFSSGLKKGAAGAAAAAKSFATAATQAINKAFGIESPSRFMIELVQNLVNTYIAEMQKSYPRINAATQRAFGQETLLRDVNKLTATSKGFELKGRTSTGFRPLAMGAGTEGASGEFQEMMNTFRKQIAGLTIQPEIYQNLLNALPDSRITTDLAGAANRRARVSEELPSFMPTQRMLGPGELEGVIAKAAADYFRTVRTPDPWVGLVGDYKRNFVDKIIALTQQVSAQPALPPAKGVRIAGALPPALFESGLPPAQELRRQAAYRRSAERSAAVMGEGSTQGLALPPATSRLALPPAAPRKLQDAISDLFDRISGAVRGSFGGPGGPRPPAGGGAGAAGGGGGQGGGAQQVASLLGLDALGDVSRLSTRELETLSATLSELRAVLDPTIQGFDRLDNQLRETIGNIGRQLERRAPDADLLTRRFGPRAGRAVSEGLIGGAFPLLFGQGAGAAAGGLAGGAAGGFAGGGLGFGLSLIGTALGTAFDTAVQSATELGAALVDTSKTFDLVKDRSLFSSKETEKLATKLSEMGFAASASILAQQEIINKVGVTGYRSLTDLASASDEAARAWGEFNLQLQAALAGPMAGLLEWVTSILALQNQSARSQQFVKDVSGGLGGEVKQEFDREAKIISGREAQGSTIFGTLFGGISKEDATKQRNELAQAYADFAIPVKVKPKLTDKQKTEEELAMLGKSLEALDIGKPLKDAVRQAAREQQDLDKQRADLVRSYEESIGNIRKQVEDEVSRRRFSILEKESQLLDLQGENRIKQLQAANAQEVALAGRGERSEVAGVAQEVAQIVADFTEQQLSAEEEAAKIKRDAALDARKFDFEAGQFKANIEKEVARLNIETARQVAGINEGVRRRNEETDSRRYNIEKSIAILKMQQLQDELTVASYTNSGLTASDQKMMTEIYYGIGDNIKFLREVAKPPAKLQEVAQVGGAGVSTANLDAIISQESGAIQALVDEALRGINFAAGQAGVTATQRLQVVTDGIDQSLEDIQTREADLEVARLRRIGLINAGLTEGIAQRVMELEQTKKIALAQYDIVIAYLEGKKIKEATTATQIATNALLAQEIELIRQRKDALEGKFGTFDATTGTGTGAIGSVTTSQRGNEIQEFITRTTAELNNLEQVAVNVSQNIGNAIGSSLANGITGLIEGTTTAKEVFGNFLKSIGQMLVQEGTKMIAMYIAIAIAKAIAGMSGGTQAAGSAAGPKAFGPGGPKFNPGAFKMPKLAANGATFANGIATFANGGAFTNSVVSSPTMFKFADGGTTRTGLMGEAGPEAIMPLKRGPDGSLGVQANGLREAMGRPPGATSKAPVLNMKFETTSINGVEYVSRDQLESAMAVTRRQAANDGASRGMNMTLDKIQNSPSTRARVGIR